MLEANRAGALLALTTSGTTNSPRTILRTTRSWWDSFEAYSALSGVKAGATVWVPGPLTATMNLFAAVHAAVVGARVVDDPADASHACLTPTLLHLRGDDLAARTRVIVGGSALSRGAYKEAVTLGLRVRSYYGAAELSFVAAGRHEGDLRPFPGAHVLVVDGVIHVASPYLCEGVGPWATVGDRGRMAGDRLVVLGRPGTATTAGATVSLADIEARLRAFASGEVAVVALPHKTLGEIVAAVCTDPDDARDLPLIAHDVLRPTHRPRLWRTMEALPLTFAGKVDRRTLVTLLEQR